MAATLEFKVNARIRDLSANEDLFRATRETGKVGGHSPVQRGETVLGTGQQPIKTVRKELVRVLSPDELENEVYASVQAGGGHPNIVQIVAWDPGMKMLEMVLWANSRGVFHRDLATDNFIMRGDTLEDIEGQGDCPVVCLIDFGAGIVSSAAKDSPDPDSFVSGNDDQWHKAATHGRKDTTDPLQDTCQMLRQFGIGNGTANYHLFDLFSWWGGFQVPARPVRLSDITRLISRVTTTTVTERFHPSADLRQHEFMVRHKAKMDGVSVGSYMLDADFANVLSLAEVATVEEVAGAYNAFQGYARLVLLPVEQEENSGGVTMEEDDEEIKEEEEEEEDGIVNASGSATPREQSNRASTESEFCSISSDDSAGVATSPSATHGEESNPASPESDFTPISSDGSVEGATSSSATASSMVGGGVAQGWQQGKQSAGVSLEGASSGYAGGGIKGGEVARTSCCFGVIDSSANSVRLPRGVADGAEEAARERVEAGGGTAGGGVPPGFTTRRQNQGRRIDRGVNTAIRGRPTTRASATALGVSVGRLAEVGGASVAGGETAAARGAETTRQIRFGEAGNAANKETGRGDDEEGTSKKRKSNKQWWGGAAEHEGAAAPEDSTSLSTTHVSFAKTALSSSFCSSRRCRRCRG